MLDRITENRRQLRFFQAKAIDRTLGGRPKLKWRKYMNRVTIINGI